MLRRDGADLALYNPMARKASRLREFVVAKVEGRGIACTPEDVLITSGSGQGLDLVNRVMLNRGDTVILEEFTYGGALTKLQRLGVNVVGAPLDDDGLRIDALDQILEELKRKGVTPKYIYTIPTVQNPTGSILPVDRREGLLGLAKKHGVAIFEDECYADLTWSPDAPPAIYSMDPSPGDPCRLVLKDFVAGFALGLCRRRLDRHEPAGRFKTRDRQRHRRARTNGRRRIFLAQLQPACRRAEPGPKGKARHDGRRAGARFRHRGREDVAAKGGIFLWIKLPDKVDVTKLVAPAAKEGLVFNPGPEWSCNPAETKSMMRLCFALPSKDVIREGVATLARVCYEVTGIPELSANIRRAGS